MRVFPNSTIKSLSDATAGQLARNLAYGVDDEFCLICDTQEEGGAIITFSEHGPEYNLIQEPENFKLLVFTGDLVWKVNHVTGFEAYADQLFQRNGTIICTENDWFMNVKGSQSLGHQFLKTLNITDSQLIDYKERLNDVGFFGSWTVFLEETDRPNSSCIKMVSFPTEITKDDI